MQLVPGAGLIATSVRNAPPATVLRPADRAELLAALADTPGAILVAGGTHLAAEYLTGLRPATLIGLDRVAELARLEIDDGEIRLGAMLTHTAGAAHPGLRQLLPGFAEAWRVIANVRVRHWATIGGNLMARCTRYELSVLLTALGARLRLLATDGSFIERTPAELWKRPLPVQAVLHHIAIARRPGLALTYRRELRPVVTLAACRDETGITAAIATEYLPPLLLPNADISELPVDFADPVSSAWYLRRAGSVLLSRARGELEESGA